MMSDEEVHLLHLTRGKSSQSCRSLRHAISDGAVREYTDAARHWYDGAILCLQKADFMRIPLLGTVQTIAILGMCYNHFGDGELGSHMWSCGIRVAQRLDLDKSSANSSLPMSLHGQRRLWWTLMICEW